MALEVSMPKIVLAGVATLVLLAAAPAQAADETFSYVRLGQAVVFESAPRPAPGIGFGIRAALDNIAVDASFLNLVVGAHPVDVDRDMTAGSLLKLEVLRYLTPEMSSSAYVGGGMSWGLLSAGRADPPGGGTTEWHGRGLQAEFTAGYELARTSPVRVFVQADASAPLFFAGSHTYAYPQPGAVVQTGDDSRYFPSIVVSMGVGWQR
jgi:hypothetical protein